ncbi:MAG TPA: type I secretion system permease/ATPase, partial [Vineibacter sp.]|nr:type I secretion system permease/ATPase [Vineibacter sp.]
SALAVVLASSRGAFTGIALISGLINVLMLTGSIFMIQIYDRVLGSQSTPTLVLLSLIAIAAYLFQGGLDIVRSRVLALIGERIDEEIGPKVHAAVADLPLRLPRGSLEALQPFRDLEAVRGFLSGPGPGALFDLPWIPIYLAVLFYLHAWLGLLAGAAVLVLIALTGLTELRSKAPTKAALEAQSLRNQLADQAQRGAEVVRAMGMLPVLAGQWQETHARYIAAQRRATFAVNTLSAAAKTFRMVLQSAVLGLGAYLAIKGELTAGAIIAGSILSSRALAPIDQAIAAWKGFVAGRQGYRRLGEMLALYPEKQPLFELPVPKQVLTVADLAVAAPGARQPIVKRVSFTLQAGQALGVIGPSACGKTSLVRALVGAWPALGGRITLDGAGIEQWDAAALGPAIGYLPQDTQLFDGTIAANIARFEKDCDSEAVIAAARAAGFHDQVVAMQEGYNTRIGQGGAHLSAGQRQRVGLARALYKDPFLVLLDEPNANLDAEGEAAVVAAIRAVRARGGVAIVVAHRPSAVAAVDMILAMKGGEVVAFGPRDEVLAKTVQNARKVIPHPAVRAEPVLSESGA